MYGSTIQGVRDHQQARSLCNDGLKMQCAQRKKITTSSRMFNVETNHT